MRTLPPALFGCLLAAMGCGKATGDIKLTVSQLETGSARSAVTTFTPTSFQLPVEAVRLFGAGEEQEIYTAADGDPVELQRASRQPAITANQPAEVGTYDTLEVAFSGDGSGAHVVIVAGCATLDAEEHCTRADPTESSLGGQPEPVEVRSANFVDPVLQEPIEVVEGEAIELNLYYDLTDAVTFLAEPGPAPSEPGFGRLGFGDGTSIEVKYPPMFAFIGPPPPVEIYEIELTTDPDPGTAPSLEAFYFPLDKWHVRLWAFFDDAGDPLARRDIWVAEAGADAVGKVSMFGNAADFVQNADGTYTISEPNPDPAFESWRIDAFERATHTGTATWTTPEGTKSIGYSATRIL